MYVLAYTTYMLEILTRDSSNPGPTKPIASERTQWIKPVTSSRTKRARVQPLRERACTAPPNRVSTVDTHASTDRTNRFVTKTQVTVNSLSRIRAQTHIRSDTQQQHTQNAPSPQ